MGRPDILPPEVVHAVESYRTRLDSEGGPPLLGLYLVGSLALGDYGSGVSDIDFVAVTECTLPPEACALLARVHDHVAGSGGPHFDGFYVPAGALRRPATEYLVLPFSQEGRFRTGEPCREVNPVTWRCLSRSGVVVLGTPPRELGIAEDDALLRRYQVGNLVGYWLPWIERCEEALAAKAPGEDCNAEALAWGVLGVARICGALETGGVLSKGDGGRHALSAHPPRWHPVIHEAIAARSGRLVRVPVGTVREGLAYMREAIARATAS